MFSLRLPQAYSPLPDNEGPHLPRQRQDVTTDPHAVELSDTATARRDSADARPRPNNWTVTNQLRAAWQQLRARQAPADLEAGRLLPPPPPEEIPANVYSPYKAVKNLGVVARRGAFWGGAIYTSYYAAQKLLEKKLTPESMATAQGFLYMGLPAVSAKPAYEFLEGTYKALGKNARIFPIEAMKKNHENDKTHFEEVKKIISVPEYITKPAEMVDRLIDKDLARFEKVGTENVSPDEIELTDRRRRWKLDYLTRRPAGLKAIEEWKTAEGRANLDSRVEQAMEDVNDADKDFIRLLVDRVCGSSVEYQRYKNGILADTPAEQRMAQNDIEIYKARGANFIVTGEPGVGKSYTIKNILGKEVGAKVIEITIPSDEDGGFGVLLPKPWDVLNQTGFVPKPEDILGKIIEALMEGECENIVLYFNEVNARSPQTRDGFKRLLDRTNEFIKNTPLATMFSIAPVTIIIDLNPGDENDKFLNDSAVIDRCIVHQFSPAITPSLADKRLHAAFEENSAMSCLPMRNEDNPAQPHPPVLDEEKQAQLRHMFDAVFPTLLKEHMISTGSARTEFVGMLVPYIAKGLRDNRPRTQTEVESYIKEHYLKLRNAQGKAISEEAEARIDAYIRERYAEPGKAGTAESEPGRSGKGKKADSGLSYEGFLRSRGSYMKEAKSNQQESPQAAPGSDVFTIGDDSDGEETPLRS